MVVLLKPELLWLVLQLETSTTLWTPAVSFEVADLGRSFGIAKWVNASFLMELSTFVFYYAYRVSQRMNPSRVSIQSQIPIAQTNFSVLQTLQLKECTSSAEPVDTFWIQGAILGKIIGSSHCKLYLALPLFYFIFTKEKKEVLNYTVIFISTYRVSEKSIHWHKICFLINEISHH